MRARVSRVGCGLRGRSTPPGHLDVLPMPSTPRTMTEQLTMSTQAAPGVLHVHRTAHILFQAFLPNLYLLMHEGRIQHLLPNHLQHHTSPPTTTITTTLQVFLCIVLRQHCHLWWDGSSFTTPGPETSIRQQSTRDNLVGFFPTWRKGLKTGGGLMGICLAGMSVQ